ncbi:CD209 antigen-like isoform X1 [Phalacrocorax carbo]|uniref:CD209 antigen-like isoform X1 n=1 Tax=Phalacrocorax carbo TaxID=9209 RepID=UPI003119F29A
MSQGEGAGGGYEKWDFDEGMGSGKGKRRDAINGGFPLDRAVVLLYVLLAVAYALFTALTVVNLRRASAAREASEQAQARSESGLATAWRNLSETRRTLDEQLSVDLKELHSQLLHVSEEVESAQRMVARCRAECGSELSDRLHLLEERDALAPVLRRLAEVEQEQSRVEARLDAALEGARNLSEILCATCPAGWQQFDKTCYFFSDAKQSWRASQESCAAFGAHLAVVSSEQENKFLANHIMDDRVFWLGLTDTLQEGNWQWVDGTPLSVLFWNSGEPNNAGRHGEDCASIYSNGRWNDIICTNAEAWICERSC